VRNLAIALVAMLLAVSCESGSGELKFRAQEGAGPAAECEGSCQAHGTLTWLASDECASLVTTLTAFDNGPYSDNKMDVESELCRDNGASEFELVVMNGNCQTDNAVSDNFNDTDESDTSQLPNDDLIVGYLCTFGGQDLARVVHEFELQPGGKTASWTRRATMLD